MRVCPPSRARKPCSNPLTKVVAELDLVGEEDIAVRLQHRNVAAGSDDSAGHRVGNPVRDKDPLVHADFDAAARGHHAAHAIVRELVGAKQDRVRLRPCRHARRGGDEQQAGGDRADARNGEPRHAAG